ASKPCGLTERDHGHREPPLKGGISAWFHVSARCTAAGGTGSATLLLRVQAVGPLKFAVFGFLIRPPLTSSAMPPSKQRGPTMEAVPCWQKSSCSDWKRQRVRPRKRPTARGSSLSHCRPRRRPRSPTYRPLTCNLILRKTPRPVTHGQRAGTCHLPPVGRQAQMTN